MPTRAEELFALIDKNCDGIISPTELLDHCLEQGMEPEVVSVLFQKVDRNNDSTTHTSTP